MRKALKYFIFTIILSFSLCFNVNAECSYAERKALREKAKNIEIVVEPKVEIINSEGNTSFGENEPIVQTKHTFDIHVLNVSEETFVKYYDTVNYETSYISYEDLTDGVYTFKDETSDKIITYEFEIYSTIENCSGTLISTKKVKKPKFNIYSTYSICSEEALSNYSYCKKYITEDFELTEDEFMSKVTKIKNANTTTAPVIEEKLKITEIVKKYWYYSIPVVVVIAGTIVIVMIRRKRSEL